MRTAARVSRTHYPGFIFGLPLRRDQIPVFTYHDVTQDELRGDLEYLRDNGYRTLSLEEYLQAQREKSRRLRVGRAVLLSFDDARISFWHTALPLLRAFSAHATLFVPTYWMEPPAHRSAGMAGDDLFMSWPQLRACVDSGLVDVQSHAHRHALVAITPRLVDFANPSALAHYDIYDWPMRSLTDGDELGSPVLGTPVYRSTPLLSAAHRYLESGEVTQACRDFVQRSGGEHYFSNARWRSELQAFHRRAARDRPGRLMPPMDFERLMASEFEYSREAFLAALGYAPTCLAYPWMLGSRTSLELAQRYGLRAAFGVALDFAAERDRTLPIPVYGRLKCDWLRFMPGMQRRNAFAVLHKKLTGLAGSQHLAH